MSHQAVQQVLERTLTDEGFRSKLFHQPDEALAEYDLTDDEKDALRAMCVDTESSDAALEARRSKRPLWTLGLM